MCMSRLIERGSHFRFFSASASLVFNTIFAALIWARSSLSEIFVNYGLIAWSSVTKVETILLSTNTVSPVKRTMCVTVSHSTFLL